MRPLLLLVLLLMPVFAQDALDPAATRRLEVLIASVTDPRKSIHDPAVVGLISIGEAVLPDLQVLAGDAEPTVRARVAMVAAGVGGQATLPLLARLAEDRSDYVREVATLGLGRTRSSQAYDLLAPRLQDPVPGVRDSAALALGQLGDLRAIPDLALWPAAGGAQANLLLRPYPEGDRQLKRIRKSMQSSLKALVIRSDAMDEIAKILPGLSSDRQRTLLETSWEIGDPRLSPVLAELLASPHPEVRRAAAVSLAANGDGRAIAALVRVATGDPDTNAREAAADTLRTLTGHRAAAGAAWALWWEDHAAGVAATAERDAFIAALHDPTRRVHPRELAAFSPQALMALVDGVIGSGAPWWPAAAWRALRQDDAARWTPVLLQRYEDAAGDAERVALVVILDGLGDPVAQAQLATRLAQVREARKDPEARTRGSLHAALVLAVEGQPEKSLSSAKR